MNPARLHMKMRQEVERALAAARDTGYVGDSQSEESHDALGRVAAPERMGGRSY